MNTSYNEKLLTTTEYAAQASIEGEPIGVRVSTLIRQKFIKRGRIESYYSECNGERRAWVRWDDGTEGGWPTWMLRREV